MKKLAPLFLVLLVLACAKDDLITDFIQYSKSNIFDKEGGVLTDATKIEFDLPQSGEYILNLQDEFTNKIVTKEIFIGNEGLNTLNVFTKVVPRGSYYLILTDKNGNKVEQTKISI
jgi:hypothetical protein